MQVERQKAILESGLTLINRKSSKLADADLCGSGFLMHTNKRKAWAPEKLLSIGCSTTGAESNFNASIHTTDSRQSRRPV